MNDGLAEAQLIRLVFHDDDDTPQDFVIDLARNVFGKSEREAIALMALSRLHGKAACGPYPTVVAKALLEAAQRQIRASGHPLRISSESGDAKCACSLCGAPAGETNVVLEGGTVCLCKACVLAVIDAMPEEDDATEDKNDGWKWACDVLARHFNGIPRSQLVTTVREFPAHMRADVQAAVDRMFGTSRACLGIHEDHYGALSFAGLMKEGRNARPIAPLQYHDVDVGEASPVKCLNNGLWLSKTGDLRFAVLLCFTRQYDQLKAIRIEIAVPTGAAGAELVQSCFVELERAVKAARSYRGKILSLDADSDYHGRSRGIMVHRLPSVSRDEVILPEQTLKLLDRNVLSFVGSRDALRRLGQSTRKGILLYGPPGTGKTHTIRYLASNLPGHSTLIITAEQMGLLGAYMSLARLLQPTMVIIEDVDLIARDRTEMGCEETLLNKLLNEMDGLKEDADILFVLTTNRPEDLESALAGRPGRIDQAIEVPLPDAIGRDKLVRLYGKGLPLEQAVIDEAVHRTDGASCAFIKELARRLAQASIARDGGKSVISEDIDQALDDMLFSGGRLNAKLLGGAQSMAADDALDEDE